MKNIKLPNFFFTVIAIILGAALYKQFDFGNLKFEKPALAILYAIVLIFSIYGIVKNYKKPADK
ncbi:hypothetical protein SAMN04488033_1502 [Salegentibacter agarivorans]|jgi:hypothetical protein|uniref:ATP synthase F0 sector subunit C n=1 Tax=Salegentibacter agarivorans TaxID=345907 RepID=A0A1I2Q9L6_9FLAO|nr:MULTISPECIES: hypothetical protein [Salegentibacter]APS38937.1 ATP synthase F0 sector subunit C [Salegentibacter sp. T436]SFG25008.1 hypothetical protein SAMN04488033_1502 [Salegentibacter agarivorans]